MEFLTLTLGVTLVVVGYIFFYYSDTDYWKNKRLEKLYPIDPATGLPETPEGYVWTLRIFGHSSILGYLHLEGEDIPDSLIEDVSIEFYSPDNTLDNVVKNARNTLHEHYKKVKEIRVAPGTYPPNNWRDFY